MLELTAEQLAGLTQIDARGFVKGVGEDLLQENPRLAGDDTLSERLWAAYRAAGELGIASDTNLVAFLRLEAYSPGFYRKQATCAWITRPGRSPDERFHDYLRVMRWRIENPAFKGGSQDGGDSSSSSGSSGSGTWADFGARWRRFVGRSSGSRDS
jgi:hypothetical protein